jgi:hypothetical protein
MSSSLVIGSLLNWLFGVGTTKKQKKSRVTISMNTDRVATSSSTLLPNVTTSWTENGHIYRVYYAREPFAKGVCKLAYEGWIVGDGPR